MAMNCCPECFKVTRLKELVHDKGSKGACDCCGSSEVSVLPAAEVYPLFEGVLAQVEPLKAGAHYFPESGEEAMAHGDMLPDLIASTWEPFLSDRLSKDRQCDLLDAIRSPSMSSDDPVSATPSHENWALKRADVFVDSERELWLRFCDVVKYERRYVMDRHMLAKEEDPHAWLPDCLEESTIYLNRNEPIFRARINPADKWGPLLESEMGAPDKAHTQNSRTSPRGIRVFYGALDRRTALAETRPEPASRVSVLQFSPKRRLVVADLTNIPKLLSPFGQVPDIVAFNLRTHGFMECLNRAFAEPVRREDAEIDYVPTQYIAELIKSHDYNAVVYHSSLRKDGRNIAVFDPDDLHPSGNVALYKVLSVRMVTRCEVTPKVRRGAASVRKAGAKKSAGNRRRRN